MLLTLGQVGGSPGGARPKALIALNEDGHAIHGTDELPEDYAHYLVKFRDHLINLGKKAEMKAQEVSQVLERAQAAISKWEVFASKYGASRQSTHRVAAALAKVRL